MAAKTKTKPVHWATEIDDDLRVACADRADALHALTIKDSPANRTAYADACVEVDDLLDQRNRMAIVEALVTH